MTDDTHYQYIKERLSFESLLDYIFLHSYNVSSDWLNWNTAWWRGWKDTGGAKSWRYILWDEDATFGHYINDSDIPDQSPDADPCNPEILDPNFVDFEGHVGIFSRLFENEEFLQMYINRYADLNNTYFSWDFIISLLDSLINQIAREMPRHIARWGGTMNEWKSNVQAYVLLLSQDV